MLKRQPKRHRLSNALSLDKITAQSGELESLIQKANQLANFTSIVNDSLPDFLKDKLMVNGLQNGALILTSPSASLATRVRVSQQEILSKLHLAMPRHRISTIKIKIRPGKFRKKPPITKRTLSKENAQLLREEAGRTQDQKLRDVLAKLADHAS